MSSQKRILKVRVSFEPNRMSQRYLADAYERLVPVIDQGLKTYSSGKVIQQMILLSQNKTQGDQQ